MYAVTVDFIQDTTLDRKLPHNENFMLKSKEDTTDISKSMTSVIIVICRYVYVLCASKLQIRT